VHEVRGRGVGQPIEVLEQALLGAGGVAPRFVVELPPRA